MKKQKLFLVGIVTVLFVSGCSWMKELGKTFWGSSTRALEEARPSALRKTFRCTVDGCFDKVLAFAKPEPFGLAPTPAPNTPPPSTVELFLQDRAQRHIVVIGVPGSVDTTEVGIFFEPVDQDTTLVELSSLSTNAKVRAAELIFPELEKSFPVVVPDGAKSK